jgi:glycosyltransferase involved in cell wall biosynthesis
MSQPIRVLLIAPSLRILGGQAVQATRLLRELRKEPELRIEFQPINPDFPALLAWVARVPYLRTALTFAMYNAQLLWRIPRYDVVHTFSAGLSSYTLWTIPAVLWSRLFGRKFILNYRDGQIAEHLERWRSAAATMRLADVIISPSEYVVDVLKKHGIAASTIFNVIDLTPFRFRARRKLRPVFMTNRILEPLYNVDCVLRAFQIVQSKYPEASLKVAHDGVCRPHLEALARQLGLRNTQFVGRVPHARVPDLYDEADIYLTSPNIDCMPGSLLECYASGLPLVATRTGGIPFIVRDGETGLLVECNDHEAMARCAIRLLEDEDLVERITRQGFAELDKYDWQKGRIGEKWMAVYRRLAADQ